VVTEQKRNTDGRIARGERTRDAIVEAHTALLREGVLKPTGKVIAARAGISLRTLWLNFNDLESLLRATTSYWLDADARLRRPIDPDLALPERIELYCRQRALRLEHIAPGARSATLGEPFSEVLQESRRAHVQRSVEDLALTFGRELAAAGDESQALAAALFLATGLPGWLSLRDDLALDVEAAEAVMRRSLVALLA
jgi:TetR/AcrR family transcriptional regulator of autoinduction and epiphytic fitness